MIGKATCSKQPEEIKTKPNQKIFLVFCLVVGQVSFRVINYTSFIDQMFYSLSFCTMA